MSYTFVSIQGTYNKIELALFRDATCMDTVSRNEVKASSYLIPLLDDLLSKNKLSLKDLSFIAVDKGPGAFTSLRVTVATVNGIAFAHQLPLIGINSLQALVHTTLPFIEQQKRASATIVCLLNAFNNDVYYLLSSSSEPSEMGCEKIDDVIAILLTKFPNNELCVVGNGFELHHNAVTKALGDRIYSPNPAIVLPSAESIGQMANLEWLAGNKTVAQIAPFYLKTQLFAIKK